MIRPFTCICLVLAASSGLYLYQVKQRAFALDADLRGTFHDIDLARERTRMLRADWALMNDPERLQALADQYLSLKPMGPSQLMTMDQLAAALPPPAPPTAAPDAVAGPAAPATDPTHGMPMAEAAPMVLPHTHPTTPEVALLQPVAVAPTVSVAVTSARTAPAAVVSDAPAPAPVPAAPLPAVPAPVTAPMAVQPKVAQANPKPVNHWVKRSVPTLDTRPWLADATASAPTPVAPWPKPHHGHHRTTPPPAQFYAANEAVRQPSVAPRITPPAATVMYSPASGSSLGMAASATLAPPRPLYSTSQ